MYGAELRADLLILQRSDFTALSMKAILLVNRNASDQ